MAWRILRLKNLSRERPRLPATICFTAGELEVLALMQPQASPSLDTLHEAVTAMARLGGYLARKNDKSPGLKTLARAHQRLCLLVAFHQQLEQARCV